MSREYDFSKGKRSAILKVTVGNTSKPNAVAKGVEIGDDWKRTGTGNDLGADLLLPGPSQAIMRKKETDLKG